MLTMKITLVLLVCSIIGILEVKSQECVPEQIQNFDPNKISGVWYAVYVKPNLTGQVSNVIANITYDAANQKFVGTLTVTFSSPGTPEVHDTTWTINNNNVFDAQFVNLSQFDSIYTIVATDYDQYMIKQGRPSATAPNDLTIIYTRQQCGNPASIAAAEDAVNKQCWDFSQFTKDATCLP